MWFPRIPALLWLLIALNLLSMSLCCFSLGRSTPSCHCEEFYSGCIIDEPPPRGYKCKCRMDSKMTYTSSVFCVGDAVRCQDTEYCPGNDTSYCACKRGGGICGEPRPNSYNCDDCDCSKSGDWKKSQMYIANVTYQEDKKNVTELEPLLVAEKEFYNPSGERQSMSYSVRERIIKTLSYTHTRTSGTEIHLGMSFETPLPDLGGLSFDISGTFSKSESHEFGETESKEVSYTGTFPCTAPKFKHFKCITQMKREKVDIPYTMTVRAKHIQNCFCESYGVFTANVTYKNRFIQTSQVIADYPNEVENRADGQTSQVIAANEVENRADGQNRSFVISNESNRLFLCFSVYLLIVLHAYTT